MIPVTLDEIRGLALGVLDGDAPDGLVNRIHADSRDARPGDLFVALNTGVDYVGDARTRGAVTLVPDDQNVALASLARLVRDRSEARVVAVVGSTGKTSTKDALGALCAAVTPTVYAHASQNNEIGLPLTVLRLEPDTQVLVTELGMRGLGQIAELCEIARPDLALVSALGPEHLELVGSVENAIRANAEAIEALPAGGIAVVPSDANGLEPFLARDDLEVRTFDRTTIGRRDDRWVFDVGGESVELALPFPQRHMAENVLAALTAYAALGLPLDRVGEGAARIRLSAWRGETTPLPGGGFVVNDAYNANPTSMRAALLDLTERADGRRRVAILGEMAELGESAASYHEQIGELLRELGIESVVAVGPLARAYLSDTPNGRWVATRDELRLADLVGPGDAVLVKASRAGGLEGIPDELANIAGAWSAS